MLHEKTRDEKDETEERDEIDNLVNVLLATRKIACDNLLSMNNHFYMIGRCAPVAAWLGLQAENANHKAMHDLAEQYRRVEKSIKRYEEEQRSEEKKSAGCEVRGAEQSALRTTHDALSLKEGVVAEIGVLHSFCCTIENLLDDIKAKAREIDASVVIGRNARIIYKN